MKKEIFNEEVAAQIAGALLGAQAVQLKSEAPYFVWASGWHSPIYCDNRKLQSYLEERELIADSLCSLIEQEYPEAEAIISVATALFPGERWPDGCWIFRPLIFAAIKKTTGCKIVSKAL